MVEYALQSGSFVFAVVEGLSQLLISVFIRLSLSVAGPMLKPWFDIDKCLSGWNKLFRYFEKGFR